MRRIFAAALAAVALSAACGPEPGAPGNGGAPGGDGPKQGDTYEATGMVLDDGSTVELCLGAVQESLPPQCGGIPIANWDWDDAPNEETAAGITWGTYHVVGTFDGTTFTVTEPPAEPTYPPDEGPMESPCLEPEGGWQPSDPSRISQGDLDAAVAAARRSPDHAGVWVTYLEEPVTENNATPDNILLNVAFTSNLAEHEAELAAIWGGPLCVVEHELPLDELLKIQKQLQEIAQRHDIDFLFSSTDERLGIVEIGVVISNEAFEQELAERFGPGVVDVQEALKPVP